MTKLKTLKDLTGMVGMLPLKSHILDINVVKQEAIKHIKELEEVYSDVVGDDYNFLNRFAMPCEDQGTDANNVIKWIKWFFNITEEELK